MNLLLSDYDINGEWIQSSGYSKLVDKCEHRDGTWYLYFVFRMSCSMFFE